MAAAHEEGRQIGRDERKAAGVACQTRAEAQRAGDGRERAPVGLGPGHLAPEDAEIGRRQLDGEIEHQPQALGRMPEVRIGMQLIHDLGTAKRVKAEASRQDVSFEVSGCRHADLMSACGQSPAYGDERQNVPMTPEGR